MCSGELNLTFHTASALPSEPLKVEILIMSLLDKLSAVTNTRECQLERKKSSLGLSISEVLAIYRKDARAEQLTSSHPGSREKGKEREGLGRREPDPTGLLFFPVFFHPSPWPMGRCCSHSAWVILPLVN